MGNSFFFRYRQDGRTDFFCQYAEDDCYLTVFLGETFGLVDGEGHEYDTVTCRSPQEFLSLIRDNGTSVVYDLNGAFVAALYNKKSKTLRLLNDRFGLFPVYVASDAAGGWYVTTDVGKLRPYVTLDPDYIGITEYLFFDYCLEDRTFFKNVEYMFPGQEILFSPEKKQERIYYLLPALEELEEKTRSEYREEFGELYCHAIDIRKEKETVVGLTGGFDSRLILAILGGSHTHTFNFGNPESGDQVGASFLANAYHTDHHFLSFSDVDIISDAREIVKRCDGQCPWERFYVLNSAKEKAKIPDCAEISGMGGDAISGQKSNFTGLFPAMGRYMTSILYAKEENRIINDITRGRIAFRHSSYYGKRIAQCEQALRVDFFNAAKAAESGKTFGNYTMRLKLRTLERRVTASSMWLTGQFLPIRFPIYDYTVMTYFNQLPQKYRYGQNLYIDYLVKEYPKAAAAPHSETGHRVDNGHVLRTDLVTVTDYTRQKILGMKSTYTNSFGFVNDKIKECNNLRDLVSDQFFSKDGLFNISMYGDIDGLIEAAKQNGGTAMTHLKNIIQISLLNELYFDGKIKMFYRG